MPLILFLQFKNGSVQSHDFFIREIIFVMDSAISIAMKGDEKWIIVDCLRQPSRMH
jgi:hypothetical protein